MSEFSVDTRRAEALLSAYGVGYAGARSDRPALRNWHPSIGSADRDTLGDLPSLRARSRDAIRNHPLATGIVDTKVLNVVGTGLRAKPAVDREFLGLGEEASNAWERQASRLFRHHCESLDIEGELGFAQQQELAFRSVLESGDLLVIRRFDRQRGDLLGTKVQLVEADRISNPRFRLDGERLAGGVETDLNGRAVAYHVADIHPGELLRHAAKWERVPVRGRSGRVSKLLFFKLRPGQRRGVPDLAAVLELLKQLTRLSEAELMGAVLAGAFTVFLKSDGAEEEVLVGQEDAAGQPAGDERDLQLGPGAILELEAGEDISTAAPGRPNDAFAPFWEAIVREIGIGTGLPYEIIVKHFQSSYSASRAAFLAAWKYFLSRRRWLGSGYCSLVYEWTVGEAVAQGLLEAPGFFADPMARRAWLGVQWYGDAPGQIDELKAVKAARERVAGGFSTEEEETIALTGQDWEQNQRQRVREVALRKELGTSAPKPPAGVDEDDAGDDPDEADLAERREAA